ncbi:hypothetical protein IFM89_000936 [Coptis chinensis]|uniref:Storage protein n=1 Tax=Coptis chinensis TaxID=261450 RepID=A0A835IIA8_9MAGN|nr:hypothetical protein IFM89_000936 [Coptis chinensis]
MTVWSLVVMLCLLMLGATFAFQVEHQSHRNLLAISAGIKQKKNVDTIVQKFFSENFTVILFHYDCNVDGWQDLEWSNKAIHIVAHNQTKWWFAKRFLHPGVVSIYDYIFIWDEDLGVENFHPGSSSEELGIIKGGVFPAPCGVYSEAKVTPFSKTLNYCM